jgi:hypothetical protein
MPSVTQVLKFVQDKAFARVPASVLEIACDRGQEVHRLCVGYAKCLWVGEGFPKFLGYYNSFTRWFDEYVEEVILAEERLYDPVLNYDGEPDLILVIKGDSLPSLWDLKTPVQPAKSWRPQVAAYRHLAITDRKLEIGRVGCIRLSPEGRPPILDESTDTVFLDFNIFRSALNIYHYFN